MIFKLEGNAAFTASKERENELSSFAAILLPPESAHFYPDGNFRGNTMENSGKQNPEMGFKPPRAEANTSKWLFLNNLRSMTFG